jgi:hypothetical protein
VGSQLAFASSTAQQTSLIPASRRSARLSARSDPPFAEASNLLDERRVLVLCDRESEQMLREALGAAKFAPAYAAGRAVSLERLLDE